MNKLNFKFLILFLIAIFNLSVFGAKEEQIVFSNKLENLEESEDALLRGFLAVFSKDNLSNDFINASCAIYKYNFLNPYKINSDLLNAAIVQNLFNLSFKDFSKYTKTIVGRFFLGLIFVKEQDDFGCLPTTPSFNCMPAIKYNEQNFEKINAAIDKSKAGEIAFFNLFNKTIGDKYNEELFEFIFKNLGIAMIVFYLIKFHPYNFYAIIKNILFTFSSFFEKYIYGEDLYIDAKKLCLLVIINIYFFIHYYILFKDRMNAVFRMKKECIEIAKALYSLKNACELIENDEELLNYIPEVNNFECLFNSEDKELNSLLKVLLSKSFLVEGNKLFFDSKIYDIFDIKTYDIYKKLLNCKEKLIPFFALIGVIDSRLVVFNFDEQLKDNEFFCKVNEFRNSII